MNDRNTPRDRKLPRSIHLTHALVIRRPRAEVFRFLTHEVPACYPELARGHERFEVIGGGPLRLGAEVDCRERAGDQEVHHRYRVMAFEPDRHLHYASTPSHTFIHLRRRIIEGRSDTHVDYDLSDDAAGTRLDMSIVIQLPSLANKWIALLAGTARLWGAHQREELERLRTMIEAGPRPSEGTRAA